MSSENLQTAASLDVGRLLELVGIENSSREIAAVLGVNYRRVARWKNNPRITLDAIEADRLALSIDKHPFEVWGWDWVDAE